MRQVQDPEAASTKSATSLESTGSTGATAGSRRSGTTPFTPTAKAALQSAVDIWCAATAPAQFSDPDQPWPNPATDPVGHVAAGNAATEETYGKIEDWDVSKVIDMSELFKGKATCNPPIGNWKVGNVKNMRKMFHGAEKFNQHIDSWMVGQVTDMSYMFSGAIAFNKAVGSWVVSQVTDMSYMFAEANDFHQVLQDWDVSQVTNMTGMFKNSQVTDSQGSLHTFSEDLNCWDVSNVTDMTYMFAGAENFTQTLCWNLTGKDSDDWLSGANFTLHDPSNTSAHPGYLGDTCKDTSDRRYCRREDTWGKNRCGHWNATTNTCGPFPRGGRGGLNMVIVWVGALLALAVAAVIVYVLVTVVTGLVDAVTAEDEPPTPLEQIKTVLADITGLDASQLDWQADDRRSGSAVVQIHTASPAEAYTVIRALSTTSSATVTQMVVQQLQSTNYTGSMPTMVTTVLQSVTNAGSSSDSDSDNTMILIAVAVAAVCLLLTLLVIGALVYLWKRNKQPAQPSGEPATPHQITMGSVGAVMNPIHAPQHMKTQQ